MTDLSKPVMFNSDSPLDDPHLDRLGYRPFARTLAKSIMNMVPEKGLVIGIYGPWGSGKTTLRNFITSYLEKEVESQQLIIVPFNPWWFSGRDDLIKTFFTTLTDALIARRFPTSITKGIMRLGGAVGEIPTGAGKMTVKELLKPAGAFLFGDFGNVQNMKEQLAKELLAEKVRILITIDDIDRLSAEEIIHLFRVIKAVADLPNVIYLLTFEKDVVVQSIEGKLVPSGEDYIEKIVQVPFQIPAPDRDAFRVVFIDAFNEVIKDVPENAANASYLRDIYVNGVEKFLTTPRRIFRLLNTINVTLSGIASEVDPVDLLAIETLRLYCPTAYAGIIRSPSQFVSDLTFRMDRNRNQLDKEKEFMITWLSTIPQEHQSAAKEIVIRLFPRAKQAFAGVEQTGRSAEQFKLGIHNEERFPIYFQFAIPGWGVSRDEAAAILDLSDKPNDLRESLSTLRKVKRPNGSTRLSSFLDTASDLVESMPSEQLKNLLEVLIMEGDSFMTSEDYGKNPLQLPFGNEMAVLRLVHLCLKKLEPADRLPVLAKLFSGSRSIATIVCTVSSLETDQGNRIADARDQLITKTELQGLEQIALSRIEVCASDGSLARAPELKRILLCWRNWSSPDTVAGWIKQATSTDESLLEFLEHFFVTSAIRSDSLAYHLVDISPLRERAKKLVEQNALSDAQRKAVEILLEKDDFGLAIK